MNAEKEIGLTPKDGLMGQLRATVHGVEAHLADLFSSLNTTIRQAEAGLRWTLYTAIISITLIIAALLLWPYAANRFG